MKRNDLTAFYAGTMPTNDRAATTKQMSAMARQAHVKVNTLKEVGALNSKNIPVHVIVKNISQFRHVVTKLFEEGFHLHQSQVVSMTHSPARSIRWQKTKLIAILNKQREAIKARYKDVAPKKVADFLPDELSDFQVKVRHFLGAEGYVVFDALGFDPEFKPEPSAPLMPVVPSAPPLPFNATKAAAAVAVKEEVAAL